MIKQDKDWKLRGTSKKRPGDTGFQAGDTWRACASGCHGLDCVLRAAPQKRMLAGSRVHEPHVYRPHSHRARAQRPRRLVSGVGEVRFQVTWGEARDQRTILGARLPLEAPWRPSLRASLTDPPREGPRTSSGLPSAGRPNLGGPGLGFRLPAGRARGWSLTLTAAAGGAGGGGWRTRPCSSCKLSQLWTRIKSSHLSQDPRKPRNQEIEIVEFWVPVGIDTKPWPLILPAAKYIILRNHQICKFWSATIKIWKSSLWFSQDLINKPYHSWDGPAHATLSAIWRRGPFIELSFLAARKVSFKDPLAIIIIAKVVWSHL